MQLCKNENYATFCSNPHNMHIMRIICAYLPTKMPMRNVLADVCKHLGIHRSNESNISTVWEDNTAALSLLNTPFPQMTLRSKHIAIWYHWTWIALANNPNLRVLKIDTKK